MLVKLRDASSNQYVNNQPISNKKGYLLRTHTITRTYRDHGIVRHDTENDFTELVWEKHYT